ncbi:MAG: hypothetical protein ACFFG0_38930 [Candidatus Thorarchaeota archaeon]
MKDRTAWLSRIYVIFFVFGIFLTIISFLLAKYSQILVIIGITFVLIGTIGISQKMKKQSKGDLIVLGGFISFVVGFLLEMVDLGFEIYILINYGIPITLMVIGLCLLIGGSLIDDKK